MKPPVPAVTWQKYPKAGGTNPTVAAWVYRLGTDNPVPTLVFEKGAQVRATHMEQSLSVVLMDPHVGCQGPAIKVGGKPMG